MDWARKGERLILDNRQLAERQKEVVDLQVISADDAWLTTRLHSALEVYLFVWV